MELEKYLPALEEEIGKILSVSEEIPGVYVIEADKGGRRFAWEYYVVFDAAPIARKVRNYGKKIDGLRLYAQDDVTGGWHIVQYETNKYKIAVKKEPIPEWMFRDTSLFAMEFYPEYFGNFPVPFHTPRGCTLRHWELDNGIYWLETSMCEEFLAVCHPIWSVELSDAAVMCGEVMQCDKDMEGGTPYRFFPKELSCVPIYELLQTRDKWGGTVIDRPALMNAIWEYIPAYAMRLNGQSGGTYTFLGRLDRGGLPVMPGHDGRNVIGMFPETGTDFLLLE